MNKEDIPLPPGWVISYVFDTGKNDPNLDCMSCMLNYKDKFRDVVIFSIMEGVLYICVMPDKTKDKNGNAKDPIMFIPKEYYAFVEAYIGIEAL